MNDRRALALLFLLHVVVVAIVQPRGEFPINDDWAFAQSVRWLLDEGRLRLSDWVPMYLVPQTLAGGLVAWIFGFSFEALRHLTQSVALLTLLAAFAWFRVVGLDRRDALFASVVLAAFPAWPVLANSYMTDLYALALALPAATFFLKALDAPSTRLVAFASLFSVAATLQRHVALVIPLAFMVTWLWTRRPLTAREVVTGTAPLLLAFLAAVAFHAYLAAGPGVPETHRASNSRMFVFVQKAFADEPGYRALIVSNAGSLVAYLGLFSIPWLAWWGMNGASRAERALVWGGGFAILAATFAFGWLPPYRPDHVMDADGIGPRMLHGAMGRLARGEGWFWKLVAVPAAFAAAAVALAALKSMSSVARHWRGPEPRVLFLAALIAAYLGPFALTDYFDRYLLFILPFFAALWACLWTRAPARPARGLAVAWIAFALGMGAAATHDYFAWNRARWDAIRMAERLGGDAESIDGGFEYGGLNRFEKRAQGTSPGKSWYWVRDDRYIVTFANVSGYDAIETWKVSGWLPTTPKEVKLLRRSD